MRRFLTTLLILILFSANFLQSQQYWIHMPSPTHLILTKCIFTDSLYGWAAGDSGMVINTTNNGNSWNIQNSGITATQIDNIFFLNRRLGWAVSNDYSSLGSFFLKTTNGGINWTNSRFTDTTLYLFTVFFTDSLNGYVGDFTGHIVKTTNGGSTWNRCSIDSSVCYTFPVRGFNFLNSLTGYAVGGQMDIVGVIWKTTNSGLNWHSYCLAPEPLHDIKFIGSTIIATGGDFEYGSNIVRSDDGGSSWHFYSTNCFGIGENLAFRTPTEVWIPLGFSQRWALNIFGGDSSHWVCIPAPDSSAVYTAQFTSPTNGWAFGTYGGIFKYNTAIIGIANNQNGVPYKTQLYQNYPNPFNPSTSIRFYLAKTAKIKIIIYDVTGREIKILADEVIQAGEHSVNFDAGYLPSGVYFYRLQTSGFDVSKKMLLVK